MDKRRGSTTRSIGLLVAGMLTMGAFALAPATAHVGTSTKHLQKHLDKRYIRGMQWGPVRMSVGEGPRQLTRFRGLTWFANCEQDEADGSIHAFVTLTTSNGGGFLSVTDDFGNGEEVQQTFDPSDNANPVEWADVFGNLPGGSPFSEVFHGAVQMPGGPTVLGDTVVGTNFGGSSCYFSGQLFKVVR